MFTFLKRFCMIAGVGTVLVSSVAIGLVPREAKAVDVGTVAVIRCPDNVHGRINWPNKIGSDPAFSPVVDNMPITASYVSIARSGQTISCSYRISHIQTTSGLTISSGGIIRYNYTAKRQMLNCKPTSPETKELTCTVKD
jgi:hypothetical protein